MKMGFGKNNFLFYKMIFKIKIVKIKNTGSYKTF